jgi:hypothetical protein
MGTAKAIAQTALIGHDPKQMFTAARIDAVMATFPYGVGNYDRHLRLRAKYRAEKRVN